MRKFLWSLVMCLCVALCSTTFTSCSSDDDTPTTETGQSLLGTWQLTAVSGTEWEDGVTTNVTLTDEIKNTGFVVTPTYFISVDDLSNKEFDTAIKDWVYSGGLIRGTYAEWNGVYWKTYGANDADPMVIKSFTNNKLVVHTQYDDGDEGCNVTATYTKINDKYDYWGGLYLTSDDK